MSLPLVPDRPALPCIVPGDNHSGEVHLYASGRLCDGHAPGPAITRIPNHPMNQEGTR